MGDTHRGRTLFEKSALPRPPPAKTSTGGEAARQESHLLEKGKELFSEIFFECCPFCSTVPYSEKAFRFLSSLKQEKPPEYPRGLFLCPENVRQAVSQRLYSPGRARYCGRGLPLGEKAEGGHCGISPASPLLRVPFYLSGGERAGRPLVFEEGRGSGRGGERPSSEGSPSPIPYPFPCPTRRIRLP